MTTFQLIAALVFGASVAVVYGKDIIEKARVALKRVPAVLPTPAAPKATTNAHELVADLVDIAELRVRLTAAGCVDGAEACTVLLRILVEYRPAQKV